MIAGEGKSEPTGWVDKETCMITEIAKQNRFLTITPEMEKKTLEHLRSEIADSISWLVIPGDGEARLVNHSLGKIQGFLRKFKEFGYTEVRELNESIFPELVEALGVLKRRGLEGDIRKLMDELLAQCNLPEKAHGEV